MVKKHPDSLGALGCCGLIFPAMVLAIEPVVRGNVPSGRYGYDYHRYYYRGPGKRQVPCFAQAYHREADASSRAE